MFQRWSPFLALFCALMPVAASAQNPKLTLKLSGVTCADAVETPEREKPGATKEIQR